MSWACSLEPAGGFSGRFRNAQRCCIWVHLDRLSHSGRERGVRFLQCDHALLFQLASWTPWPRWGWQRTVTASATSLASSIRRSSTAGRYVSHLRSALPLLFPAVMVTCGHVSPVVPNGQLRPTICADPMAPAIGRVWWKVNVTGQMPAPEVLLHLWGRSETGGEGLNGDSPL